MMVSHRHSLQSGCRRWRCGSGEEGLSLLGPQEVEGLGLALLALVDPPQAQDVEQDGEQHHQDAQRQQVVVVDEGGAQPAGVALPQRLRLQVPERRRAGQQRTSHDATQLTYNLTLTICVTTQLSVFIVQV